MSKQAHILAVEVERPHLPGYIKTDPIEFLEKGNLWLGFRPHLETLDPIHNELDKKAILQIIPYVIIKHEDKILFYVRPNVGNEERLHGKVSAGIGGHIDLADIVHEDSVISLHATMAAACVREIEEEIKLKVDAEKINWSGLIYRDDGSVDRVHVGVVAEIEIDDAILAQIQSTEEIGEIRFINPSNLQTYMAQYAVEAWTKAYLSLI